MVQGGGMLQNGKNCTITARDFIRNKSIYIHCKLHKSSKADFNNIMLLYIFIPTAYS